MPVYCYKCKDCEFEFEVRHSMSYEDQKCNSCDSEDVFKIPSLSLNRSIQTRPVRAGKVVDEYIHDAKKEIKEEKKRLKSEEL